MKTATRIAIFGLSTLLSNLAAAYGPEGHALVADMAEFNLDSRAAAEVSRLLAIEKNHTLDDISSWPDAIRAAQPETGPFHFVDIPLAEKTYDEQRDCHFDQNDKPTPELTCVVAKLPEFVRILADRSKPDQDRLVALKWVVHLVGDVHQPLHAETKNDRGGNAVHLTYFGDATNLHAVWDGGVIEQRFGWKLGPDYSFNHASVRAEAKLISAEISIQQRQAWAPPGLLSRLPALVTQWANESHSLAPDAYGHLPSEAARGANQGWEKDYQGYAWPVIEEQIKKASARLAEVLNETLD